MRHQIECSYILIVRFWAAQAQRPEKRLMATDVAVPISRSAELIDLTVAELQKSNIYGPIVGQNETSSSSVSLHSCQLVDHLFLESPNISLIV